MPYGMRAMVVPRRSARLASLLIVIALTTTPIRSGASEVVFEGAVTAGGASWRTHGVSVTSGQVVTGTLDWTIAEADLNLSLLDPSGAVVVASKTSRPEVVTYRVTTSGVWRFGVKAVSGSTGYRLTVDTAWDPPDLGAWTLADIASTAGLAAMTETWTANPVDADGDGLEDVWIGYHDQGGKLWRANGDGTMSRIAGTAWPVRLRDADGRWHRVDRHACAWADVDGNGLIDAYCTVGRTGNNNVKCAVADNELWLQTVSGAFTDVGTALGVGDPYGRGRSAVLFDATGDGRPDLYVTNEKPRPYDAAGAQYGHNKFFVNVADPGAPHGFRFVRAPGWGIDLHLGFGRRAIAFDQNSDGRNDLLVTGRARLYMFRNTGDRFVDVTSQVGIPRDPVHDVVRADLDADGAPDLVEVRTSALVWQRDLGGTFGPRRTIKALTHGSAVAVGNADGDALPDVYVLQAADGFNPDDYLLLNRSGTWVSVIAPAMAGRGSDVQPLALRGSGQPVDFLVLNGDLNVAGPVMLLRLRRT